MKTKLLYQAVAIAALVAVGMAIGANRGRISPEADLAAPGAPLYEFAVTESIRGMLSKEDQAELGAAGRPPSPGPDYFWCDNCKTYHQRQAPAAPGQPAVAPGAAPPAQPVAGTRPPSPGPDFYWCDNCKTYHQRPAAPDQPGATPGAARHVHPPSTPAAGSVANQVLGADYYYCDNCKTYHRRQAALPHAAADVSRIVGSASNVLDQTQIKDPLLPGPATRPGPAAPAP